MTDAAPVRAYVESLRAVGMSSVQIAVKAGLNENTVKRLLGTGWQTGPSKRVLKTTAAALLAVRPDLDVLGPHSLLSAVATRRRLQALVVTGRTLVGIAAELGCHRGVVERLVHGQSQMVRVRTARAVRDLTVRLWLQPPPQDTDLDRRNVRTAKALAEAKGWVPLGCWDDLDDPHERPKGVPKARNTA